MKAADFDTQSVSVVWIFRFRNDHNILLVDGRFHTLATKCSARDLDNLHSSLFDSLHATPLVPLVIKYRIFEPGTLHSLIFSSMNDTKSDNDRQKKESVDCKTNLAQL